MYPHLNRTHENGHRTSDEMIIADPNDHPSRAGIIYNNYLHLKRVICKKNVYVFYYMHVLVFQIYVPEEIW